MKTAHFVTNAIFDLYFVKNKNLQTFQNIVLNITFSYSLGVDFIEAYLGHGHKTFFLYFFYSFFFLLEMPLGPLA